MVSFETFHVMHGRPCLTCRSPPLCRRLPSAGPVTIAEQIYGGWNSAKMLFGDEPQQRQSLVGRYQLLLLTHVFAMSACC